MSCCQPASLHVADLKRHRQRLRAADHDLEGDCQPSGRTRSKKRGLGETRFRQRATGSPPAPDRLQSAQRQHRFDLAQRHRAVRLIHDPDAKLESTSQLNSTPAPGRADRRIARRQHRGGGRDLGRPAYDTCLEVSADEAQQQPGDENCESDAGCRSWPTSPRPAQGTTADFDHVRVAGSVRWYPCAGTIASCRTLTVHGRFTSRTDHKPRRRPPASLPWPIAARIGRMAGSASSG